MALNIFDINGHSPEECPFYFLDANVWITVLKNTRSQQLKPYEQHYFDFFEAIITCNEHPPAQRKKLKNVPKLVMTSLLLSEIINAYMRKVAMVAFYSGRNQQARPPEFKRDYRPTSDYQTRLRSLLTDIQQFEEFMHFEDDHFNFLTPMGLLTDLSLKPDQYDFNDLYFGRLAQCKGWAIVTHDSDFLFEGLTVLTANQNLLTKGKR